MYRILCTVLLAVFFLFTPVFAAELPMDDYMGDSAIYVGEPTLRPKPNVLFIIDTSRATMGAVAGDSYVASDPDYDTGPYQKDLIYFSNQQGGFSPSKPLGGNSPVTLEDVIKAECVVSYEVPDPLEPKATVKKLVNVPSTLSTYGTYSGGGDILKAPNINDGSGNTTKGSCKEAPSGEAYATGHYLNYINSTPVRTDNPDETIIILHTYVVKEKVKGVLTDVSYTNRFELRKNIQESTLDMEPGVETYGYWAKLPDSGPKADLRSPTHEIVGDTLVKVTALPAKDGWETGIEYYVKALDPGATTDDPSKFPTQRGAFFEALKAVMETTSTLVNFGFVTYNPQNQGAVLGYDILKDDAPDDELQKLIATLPNMSTCKYDAGRVDPQTKLPEPWDCPDLIASGPNRPQAEALYDAGYYFKANYLQTDGNAPSKQSINLNAQVPFSNPCGENHIIFLTNGLPNKDGGAPNLGDWDKDGYENLKDTPDYGLGTHMMDDIAYYLKNQVDINGDGRTGDITTHVILAFQAEDDLLRRTAVNTGGEFFNVFSQEDLREALESALGNIVRQADTAFVAPVVPASSTNRTISSNRVYLGLFKPQNDGPWHGNLKKYKVSKNNELLDVEDRPATLTAEQTTRSDCLQPVVYNPDKKYAGDFIYSQSYWGMDSVTSPSIIVGADGPRNLVPSAYVKQPADTCVEPTNGVADGGDGGIVDAGGAGGTLRARNLSTRKIFTCLKESCSNNESIVDISYLRSVDSDGKVNFDALTPEDLGYQSTEDKDRNQLIDYVYGFNSYASTYTIYNNDSEKPGKRNWVLGDILHSKPLVLSYGKYSETDKNIEKKCYGDVNSSTAMNITHTQTHDFNTSFIFVGANDGMMHAFRDCDGEEVWGFVPPILLKDLKNLPVKGHEYFVDGAPTTYVHDFDGDGNIEKDDGDRVVLFFGLRRGGGNAFLTPNDPRGAYYALDVTDPLRPEMLWEIKGGGDSSNPFNEMGETWSQPRLAKIKHGTEEKVAMFVGAGYDTNEDRRWGNTQDFPKTTVSDPVNLETDTDTTLKTEDGKSGGVTFPLSSEVGKQENPKGRGLYVVEVAKLEKTKVVNGVSKYEPNFSGTGNKIWGYTRADNDQMTFSIASDLTVLDWNDDGYADRVYVGDTGGQVWRFSLPLDDKNEGVTSNWSADVIFRANPGYTGSYNSSGVYSVTSDGTLGRKFFYRPSVARNGPDAMLYFGSGDREHPLNLAVVDRVYMLFDRGQGLKKDNVAKAEVNLIDVTENTLQQVGGEGAGTIIDNVMKDLYAPTNYGWYIRLNENSGEKMLAPSVIFFGQAFFTTYAPLTNQVKDCKPGNLGVSRLYHLDYRTGEAVYNYVADSTQSAPEGNTRANKEGAGLLLRADRVRTLGEGIPSGIVTLMDASGKVTMMISASNRVGTYAAPDVKLITPVYWMQWNN